MQTLADYINQQFGVPSPGAVNDKLIQFYSKLFTGSGSPVGSKVGPGFYFDLTNSVMYTNPNADNSSWVNIPNASQAGGGGLGVYGDGSDGALVFDGAATVLGMAPTGNRYTITRDIQASSITINSGVSLVLLSCRILCTGTLTNNGIILGDGAPGGIGTNWAGGQGIGPAGATASVYPLHYGASNPFVTGANGNTGVGGTGGSNNIPGLGGAGGAGGSGSGGAGGPGGTIVALSAINTLLKLMLRTSLGAYLNAPFGGNNVGWFGGAAGGGGGGDATNRGGGGGGGASTMFVGAKAFAGTGAIHSRGGNAGNGTVGNCGGGGGGGGGLVLVVSGSVSAGAIAGQTIDANGGTHGTGIGTGANGVDGSPGLVILVAN